MSNLKITQLGLTKVNVISAWLVHEDISFEVDVKHGVITSSYKFSEWQVQRLELLAQLLNFRFTLN